MFQLERSNQGVSGGPVLGVTAKSPLVLGTSILVDVLVEASYAFLFPCPFQCHCPGSGGFVQGEWCASASKINAVFLILFPLLELSIFIHFLDVYNNIIVWVATKALICSDPLVVSIVIAASLWNSIM